MFERFTDDARRVVVYAQEECRLLRHQHIGTEHLLLGLLHEDTPTGAALESVGVNSATARDRIEHSTGRGRKEPHGHIPFTPRAKQVLELSLRHAQRLGEGRIARAHLLRALLDVPDAVGRQTLVGLGVDLEALAARADELAIVDEPESAPRASSGIRASSRPHAGLRPGWLLHRHGAEPPHELVAQLSDLAVQRDALVNAVRRYGRHDQSCDPERSCTCGLQQVLDSLEPPGSGGTPESPQL